MPPEAWYVRSDGQLLNDRSLGDCLSVKKRYSHAEATPAIIYIHTSSRRRSLDIVKLSINSSHSYGSAVQSLTMRRVNLACSCSK